MTTCKCGCEEVMHGDAFGCMTCGCMKYEANKRSDFEVITSRGRLSEVLGFTEPEEKEN
jgi:hypothetical protein